MYKWKTHSLQSVSIPYFGAQMHIYYSMYSYSPHNTEWFVSVYSKTHPTMKSTKHQSNQSWTDKHSVDSVANRRFPASTLRPIQINIYIMLGAYFSSIWRIEPSKEVSSSNQNNRDFGTKYMYIHICRLNNICIHHISYVRSYLSPAQQQLLHPKFPLCLVCWKSAVRSF